MWEIISAIGSLIPGLSVVTAFILYWFEKLDNAVTKIKKTFSNAQTIVAEQYELLKSEYVFSFAEDYFSNTYIQRCLFEICEFIEKNPNMSTDKVCDNCIGLCNKMTNYTFFWNSSLHDQYKKNYTILTSIIIGEVFYCPGILFLLQSFQELTIRLNDIIKYNLIKEVIGFDKVCEVLKDNIYLSSDITFIRGEIIQEIKPNSKYEEIVKKLSSLYCIINYIFEDLSYFDDKSVRLFLKLQSKSSKKIKEDLKKESTLKEKIRIVLNSVGEYNLNFTNLNECFEKLGEI